jgi:hypothetical protein
MDKRQVGIAFVILLLLLCLFGVDYCSDQIDKQATIIKQQEQKIADLQAYGQPKVTVLRSPNGVYTFYSAASQDGVPVNININGDTWTLYKVNTIDDGSITGAETHCDTHTIIYIDIGSGLELRDLIMHEVFHAGECLHGDTWWNSENPTKDFHPGIYHLADFMTNFIRTNPEFIAWMEKK